MDQLVHARLARELVVDVRVERDRDARIGRDRPTLLARSLDEHLVRAELVPGGAETAAVELLEVARLKRRPHGAELLPESRPEQRQVRLHTQLGVDVTEHDLAYAQLVGDHVLVPCDARATLDDERAQRLAHLERCGLARLVAEPTTTRTSAMSARRSRSGAGGSGQPARNTDGGAPGTAR